MEEWIRLLFRALRLEAERGWPDLMGRRERFSAFLARSLASPHPRLAEGDRGRLRDLATSFSGYGGMEEPARRHLVVRTQQLLQSLRPASPDRSAAPPRLNLGRSDARTPAGAAAREAVVPAGTPLAQCPGIGAATATRLIGLGLVTAGDLARHYPRDYLDYSNRVRIADLEPGTTATVVATVRRCHSFTSSRNPSLSVLEILLRDVSGSLRVTRFFTGRRYGKGGWLKSQERLYPPGSLLVLSGLVKDSRQGPRLQDPLIERLDHPGAAVRSSVIGRLQPVYGLTEGLTAERLRRAIAGLLPSMRRWPDPLGQATRQAAGLMERGEALVQMHEPEDRASLEAARHRLVFDEFLLLQLRLLQRRQRLRQRHSPPLAVPHDGGGLLGRFLRRLPFSLTGAQRRVLAEIQADMGRADPMARLVQGDVGSGKTVVAVAALLIAVDAGCQGVLMAPTEVLAVQHMRSLARWLPQLHVSVGLLTGSTPRPQRRELLQDLENGMLRVLVGTHALLEDPVSFARLGLVVVDEQHRFGVRQRDRLLGKGLQPHLLTMTATPIPRTLALALHGDLDVSQIDERPPGRRPIATSLLAASRRDEAYGLIRREVEAGGRAYVILPLVEESETLDLRSAVEVHQHLSAEVFPDLGVGLLHGRLNSQDKQAAIEAFAAGDAQVLVSTTVVEVGVDVPEASVMVIEHADRFGLAQLHQLRGRVGRGERPSHCILINDSRQPQARQRLEVMVRSNDGFELADMDLRLRGPGQVLGTRQSGLPDLALASLSDDGSVLEEAREMAQTLIENDPDLESAPLLRQALAGPDGGAGSPILN
nr:ATP-dependent DNA helicase RecG [Synechococcus sp. RSCCF101]